jgi:hypothetical protein
MSKPQTRAQTAHGFQPKRRHRPLTVPGQRNGTKDLPSPGNFGSAAAAMADSQKQMLASWSQWLQSSPAFAPAQFLQNILPNWELAPDFTFNIGRSSDPALEEKIVNDVAGYGSQLGTILDYLEILENKERLLAKPLRKHDKVKVARLITLIDQVNKAKAQLEKAK